MMMTTIDVSGAAATAEKVVETVAKIEPTVATIVGMFVPGAAPVVAMVQPFVLMGIPYLERAINDIASGNGGDFMGAMIEVMQHLSKGQPNSPILSNAELVAANKAAAGPITN
jgi:cobalamin synthase